MNPIPSSLPDSSPRIVTPDRANPPDPAKVGEFERMLRKETTSQDTVSGGRDQPVRTTRADKSAPKQSGESVQGQEELQSPSSISDRGISTATAVDKAAAQAGNPLGETSDAEPVSEAQADGEQPVSPDSGEPSGGGLVAGISGHRPRKQGEESDLPQYAGAGVQTPNSVVVTQAPLPADQLTVDSIERIQQITDLIAQTAQQVTFVGNDTAVVTLSPAQLPDSKIRIEMQQGVMQVVFTSDNASSMALLQGRGGELAAALAVRFDREIRVEVRGGGLLEDSSESSAPGASWTVQRRSQGDSSGALGAAV